MRTDQGFDRPGIRHQIRGAIQRAQVGLIGTLEDGTASVVRSLGISKPTIIEKYLQGDLGTPEIFSTEITPHGSVSRSQTRTQLVEQVIKPLEEKHGMSSAEFYKKFKKGGIVDEANEGELVMWAGLYGVIERIVRENITQS